VPAVTAIFLIFPLLLIGWLVLRSGRMSGFLRRWRQRQTQPTPAISPKPGEGQFDKTENIETLKDITYRTVDGQTLTFDICRPKGLSSKRPAIILTHGGGFRTGSKYSLYPECQDLAKLGYIAFTLDYRLAPKYPYPVQIDDVQYAVRFIKANADKYLIDSSRLGSLGGSAGGYLASILGLMDTRDPSQGLSNFSSKVQVVVNRFGVPMDMADPNLVRSDAQTAAFQEEILGDWLKGYEITDALYKEISAVTYASYDDAPMFALYSVNDQLALQSQGQRIVDALKKVGVAAEFEPFNGKGRGHGYDNAAPAEKTRIWNLQMEFLRRYLPPIQS